MKSVLGFVVLAAVSFVCGGLGEKKEVTTFREVKQEYAKSADAARGKFDGKELTILGEVMYRSEVNPSIRVGSSTDSDISGDVPDIECVFDESDVLFKNVSEKQTIKIKGVLKVTDSGMEMKPCKFVPF
jgi:hypothetical protein